MSFSCKNYDYNEDKCLMLKKECIPGRPGCVLEGRVALSEALIERIKGLAPRESGETPEKKQPR